MPTLKASLLKVIYIMVRHCYVPQKQIRKPYCHIYRDKKDIGLQYVRIMILNPTKALLSHSSGCLVVGIVPESLSMTAEKRGQKFNISPSLGPQLFWSWTTVQENFFSLLTTTSFFEAFKVTFISFPPTTLSADLLTAMPVSQQKRGLAGWMAPHQNAFQVFSLGQNSYGAQIGPIFPGQTFVLLSFARLALYLSLMSSS